MGWPEETPKNLCPKILKVQEQRRKKSVQLAPQFMRALYFKNNKNMNEDQISKVASVIEEWNPLGSAANTTDNLDGYRYEAIDIIATIQLSNSSDKVKTSIEQVLTQAFNIELNQAKLAEATDKIKSLLNS